MSKVKVLFILVLFILFVVIAKRFEDRIIAGLTESGPAAVLPTTAVSPRPSAPVAVASTSIFIPYWAIKDVPENTYSPLLYFGITPGDTGINTEEGGYKNLSSFTKSYPDEKKYLVLRMTNSQQNFAVIENQERAKRVISETVATAEKYGFSGVVLDFEVSALPFESVIKNITSFSKSLYIATHANNMTYALTLYGDTFYRLRPFDTKELAKSTDQVMIMAYDFSKANGNPGPNFPLGGKEIYGYDFQNMIDQFISFIPPEKISVIFGMYGYDWPVDDKGKATERGVSLTDNQIQKKFISECALKDCLVQRDTLSAETKATYTDADGKKHIVWFEDEKSVEKKKDFLTSRGIGAVSYWAYSYF